MEVRPVQFNINVKSDEHKHYLKAEGAVDTTGLVKPLPGEGHLIHDNILTGPKYFFKDYAYDMKSLKNGIIGKANDHQLGRLNDVGLQLGGVGIATYLASRTTNPKARIMEYAGLAAFLTAMNVYPKIAINKPAEIFHGYDIDKWYIDDQGRKKSVNQDSNYVPYDLYRGEAKGEDLDEIGDRMGIPRDIKNRHEIIKEQMRKISTQSNTLWMLTAGLATPVITALACYGLENYVISPSLEKTRNNKYNKMIADTLEKTKTMDMSIGNIPDNNLSIEVNKIISKYKGQELPEDELKRIIEILTKNIDEKTSEGIREDFTKLLDETIVVNGELAETMNNKGMKLIKKSKQDVYGKILVPTREELEAAIKTVVTDVDFVNGTSIAPEKVQEIKSAIRKVIDEKIKNSSVNKKYLESQRNKILEQMMATLEGNKTKSVTDSSIEKAVNFAKILGEFKENQKLLDKCKSFKFEKTEETVLARYYGKFEKTVIKELGITPKEMKMMRESEDYTVEILNKKISELCENEERLKKTLKKLGKIYSEMEGALHGKSSEGSNILDLINAIENNYNNTAKRLASLGGFDTTITKMVNEDVSTLGNSITTRQEVFNFIDGVMENKAPDANFIDPNDKKWLDSLGIDANEARRRNHELTQEIARYNSRGLGSSKHAELTRIIERYQGVCSSFNRLMHTFEVFKRTSDAGKLVEQLKTLDNTDAHITRKDLDYINELIKRSRDTVLGATSSDHNLKLDLVNNKLFYRDLINTLYSPAANEKLESINAKGFITDFMNEAAIEGSENGSIKERFQRYITKCRNIFGNGDIDFTKPNHRISPKITDKYSKDCTRRMAFFNLVGKNPIDFIREGSKREYGTKKWFKIISVVTSGVFGATILAQAGFGKIRNPHNIQKQVKNETN